MLKNVLLREGAKTRTMLANGIKRCCEKRRSSDDDNGQHEEMDPREKRCPERRMGRLT